METLATDGRRRFSWFAWAVLIFNFPVILWGAYVRVSYSGDGCGAHWPFCNGQALPTGMTKPMAIEFTHRMTTIVDTLLVLAMVGFAFWLFPKRHAIRRYAVGSFVFLLIEALLGAGLVVYRLVAHDQSAGRVWYLAAHLTNTMLMLAAITLTAWLAIPGRSETFRIWSAKPALLWSALVTVIVSITGSVTALGDTLFPANSLIAGVRQDLSSDSPVLLRLRVAHPAMAILGTAFVVWAALEYRRSLPESRGCDSAVTLVGAYCLQLLVGAANLTLLAPLYMQLIHLLVADLVWIAMVLVVAESAGSGEKSRSTETVVLGSEATAGKPA